MTCHTFSYNNFFFIFLAGPFGSWSQCECSSPGETRDEPLDCVVTKTNGLWIEPMTCYDSESIYNYPQIVGHFNDNGRNFLSYTCCDTYDGQTGLYLKSARFYWIFVPHLIVAIIVFVVLFCFIDRRFDAGGIMTKAVCLLLPRFIRIVLCPVLERLYR